MKRVRGFTLIELLVVIAIITILAAIVVPRVSSWIGRARMAKAVSEIGSIELALTKMLSDAGRSDMSQMFGPATVTQLRAANAEYNSRILYEILRRGRNADADLRPEVKKRMGTTYLDLPLDPWDNRYQFFPGPWPTDVALQPIRLRCYRSGEGDRLDPGYVPYRYDAARKLEEDARRPGNPPPDDAYGYPALRDEPFYVWSVGANLLDDQLWSTPDPGYEGGGDDINSWDSESGWDSFY